MLSQALVYFLCLEDISHDKNTQKRLNQPVSYGMLES